MPAIYETRPVVEASDLISYGSDFGEQFRQAVILKHTRPENLPIQQPAKFELVINLKTANALGLNVPHGLLNAADEVIE